MKRMQLNAVLILLLLMIFWGKTFSQVVINEFMASNVGVVVDPDFNESSDWIELYNTGSESANIGGYFLSDNANEPTKWEIPIGVAIEPGKFLVIWCDGYNTGLHTNFKLSSLGEELGLYTGKGALVDTFTYQLQEANLSMGRLIDGGKDWGFFVEPTPGAANSVQNFEGIVKNAPQFSPLGGIFTSPIQVSIQNTFGGDIYYTTDGSEPTSQSNKIDKALSIDKTTVIRARIIKKDQVPGEVITHSYFINKNNDLGTLPVVSICTHPDNFWSAEKGIYVQDYKPELEVPINIELFENDGSDRAGFNAKAGTKINGLYSWQLPQKMLGIYFRKEYGQGKLDYPLFFDRKQSQFDSFALRASGNDWSSTLFRDGLGQSITQDQMDLDFMAFRQCVVYVNGEYLGIHNIRPKIDEDFIYKNHDLGKQKIDMIEYEEYVEAGSIANYEKFEELYHNDLSIQGNYDLVAKEMDIENFTDFVIAEIYTGNSSIGHNVMAWKPQFGGKWKWILMDLDRGFNSVSGNRIAFYADKNVIPFGALLKNSNYVKYMGKRLADHVFTTYQAGRVISFIDKYKQNIDAEIPKHVLRWEGHKPLPGNYQSYLPIPSYNYWLNELDELYDFANRRPASLINDLVNFGFEAALPLSIGTFPANAGELTFNGLKITQAQNVGTYPRNEEITLVASAKSGYTFKGWSAEVSNYLIGAEETWSYNDAGVAQPANWMKADFSVTNWKKGQAELGYGDGGENTVIDFGNSSSNKHITYYFRKSFSIENVESIQAFNLDLKFDDGAVVYINGVEFVRQNLPQGEITYQTTALNAIGSGDEETFNPFALDKKYLKNGENIVAVEIHQVSGNSSDVSFDLRISALGASSTNFISTNPTFVYKHENQMRMVAVFESTSDCKVQPVIDNEVVLSKDCSPYFVPGNVFVSKTGHLIIEPGVELLIDDEVSFLINGKLSVLGTKEAPIYFRSSPKAPNQKWGAINLVNADTSRFENAVIEDAYKGNHPIREVAAISVFNSVVRMDGLVIENVHANPINARYSDVILKNSRLHSKITGDLINVKYGKAHVENCEFIGNNMPDTDGIDYDDITDGIIKNCIIHEFQGFNSDAIDIGERAKNITIQDVVVYNITDKGVSVGQQSSANISNSIFVNCNLGAGLKDSCHVTIDHCTFYGNETSVACYEKNVGDAGGNAIITNSILSNAYGNTYICDAKSTIRISYSSSDNVALPAGKENIFSNPRFTNPNAFNFSLAANSPCLASASDGNMGAYLIVEKPIYQLFISVIGYSSDILEGDLEFVKISNKGNVDMDISGYAFTKGIAFTFPEESVIRAGRDIYITNNASSEFWFDKGLNVYQWESGRLANNGEALKIETPTGIIIDRVRYNENSSWPVISMGQGIKLKGEDLDNHFGANWEGMDFNALVSVDEKLSRNNFTLYPNPTNGNLMLNGILKEFKEINIFNLSGNKVKSILLLENQKTISIANLKQGVYFIQYGNQVERIVLLK